MLHRVIFLILCFSIIVENLSIVPQLSTDAVFLDLAALASTSSISLPKKINVEEKHGGKNNEMNNAHHFGKTAKHDASIHDETSAKKGQTTHTHKTTEDEEKSGKKHSNHETSNHAKHHHNGNHKTHHGKYSDGHKAKKTNVLKGYRQQYHKHERKNHDSFYSNGEKKGNFENFGSSHHKKHGEFRKKSAKQSKGEKSESVSHGNKKTYKIEKPVDKSAKESKGEKSESDSYAHKKTYKIEKPANNQSDKQHLKVENLQYSPVSVIKK